ncbi:MAG TPA: response regulator [Lacipirellulaceae bacterium]|nr:response regulator [Lacipirellulaceae bacterium]
MTAIATSTDPATPNPATRGRALIVDDNVALARVTQFALSRAGFDTRVAGNGRIALERVAKEAFDLVVTDQQMPEMTGLEFLERLRALPGYAGTPVILLTAKGLELELPRIQKDLAIDAVFAKPFSPSAVVEKACQLLAAAV